MRHLITGPLFARHRIGAMGNSPWILILVCMSLVILPQRASAEGHAVSDARDTCPDAGERIRLRSSEVKGNLLTGRLVSIEDEGLRIRPLGARWTVIVPHDSIEETYRYEKRTPPPRPGVYVGAALGGIALGYLASS